MRKRQLKKQVKKATAAAIAAAIAAATANESGRARNKKGMQAFHNTLKGRLLDLQFGLRRFRGPWYGGHNVSPKWEENYWLLTGKPFKRPSRLLV